MAHRRLSIFDLSEQGRQPLTYGDDLTIVFNGAVFNYPELRTELRALGHRFVSDTDTEVILAAYRAWGTDCFARFNGMWAIAIIDVRAGELVLSRDRAGIKPLYVYASEGQLAFASETRSLRRVVGRGAEINRTVAVDFLRHGWQDHRTETLWAGIHQYPAGHYSVYGLENLERRSHSAYHAYPTATADRPNAELLEEFRTLLTDSLHLRTRSDVGCGLTLSGGVDSSAIAGLLKPEHTTYSVRFPGTPYDESRYIDAVLEHRGLANLSLTPGWDDFLADYEACQAAQDQPLASAAVVSHYTLMKFIRARGEQVILNGQGADEIGAGYDKFYAPYLREAFGRGVIPGLLAGARVTRNLRVAPDQVSNRIQRLLSPSGAPQFLAPAFSARASGFVRPPDTDVRTTSVNLLRGVGLPVLLRHEDRNAMAVGIESRPPFLDYRIVDFLLAAPTDFKLHGGVRKWGIRESVRPLLPELVYARKRKLGFATPQAKWMEEHPDFFIDAIRTYTHQPDALLLPATADFAGEVLEKRKNRFYPMVWGWWGWSSFLNGL